MSSSEPDPDGSSLRRQSSRFYGVRGAVRSLLAARLFAEQSSLILVTASAAEALTLYSDLLFFIPAQHRAHVKLLPGWEVLPFEHLSPATDVSATRLTCLIGCQRSLCTAIVTSIDVLMQKVPSPTLLSQLPFTITHNQEFERDSLIARFMQCGYQRTTTAQMIGDFAVRGAVIDFFPEHVVNPIRIEFRGNMVSRLRSFNPDSQRSLEALPEVEVLPVSEYIMFKDNALVQEYLSDAVARIEQRGRELELAPRHIARICDALLHGETLQGLEHFHAMLYPGACSALDYLAPDTAVLVDDEIALTHVLDARWELICDREERLTQHHEFIAPKESLYYSPDQMLSLLGGRPCTNFDSVAVIQRDLERYAHTKVTTISNTALQSKLLGSAGSGQALQPLIETIEELRQSEFAVAFCVSSLSRAERLHRILLDYDLEALIYQQDAHDWLRQRSRHTVVILVGELSAGFRLIEEKICLITEGEIFPHGGGKLQQRKQTRLDKILRDLAQLEPNDYIVHVDYGVGIYRGIVFREIEGAGYDFVHLEYAGETKLFLPIENIGKVQKFVANEGQAPVLDKLGSQRWAKLKAKVRRDVATLAGDLINLYAARSVSKGWRFDPAGAEDERFADGFPYRETPDQAEAIQATLNDMQSDKPMDRLVCGDVGFGKTEVALRACFKAVQHGKQVLLLAPTTLLVEQHLNTFRDRFLEFAVEIAAVSRLYPATENRKTLELRAEGRLDVVIGTHRLLQSDVRLKDLGLVIIDEEHRFGVAQKERLKRLRQEVDVLALTATPIPRTLQMSLLGIRDLSLIATPPSDRRAIRTYVAEYNHDLIRDAILKELQRGGQSFMLHNRVTNIATVTAELRGLVPEARFEFAHGQMKERELDQIMLNFLNREIDVLVCTTIIESGLDIPNANTMIVDRADRLGLAQLYQLRGRIGRSSKQAYCYLLIPEIRSIEDDARKRLNALQTLDELGMGFNLAARDLEIRGAGNLLGKDQSGNVAAVGLELYNKILHEAVLNLRGETLSPVEVTDPQVKLGISAYIPEFYIPDISERLILYQRLAALADPRDADELSLEIEDRFGVLPTEADNLLELMRYRALLKQFGVLKAEFGNERLLLSFGTHTQVNPEQVSRLVTAKPDNYKLRQNNALAIVLNDIVLESPRQLFGLTEELLRGLTS